MNETLPGVSVVVPVYNGEACVEETVRSLLALTYPRDRMELIVVNNASTDGTARVLGQFKGQIRLLTEPKQGRSYARNRGIAAATHDVVAFTDVDCIADSEWLRHLVTPLADPHTGICGGKIVTMRPCTPIEEFGESLWEQNHAINVYKPPYAISANWASPKKVLVEAGGFDAAFQRGEDVDLAYRIFQAGYSIAYSDNAVIQHRNPKNIEGLFKLGFLHGFYSVRVLKRHREFLRQFGHRRIWWGSYRLIAENLISSIRIGNDRLRLYDAVFNLGKKAGKISGSIRFGYLEL